MALKLGQPPRFGWANEMFVKFSCLHDLSEHPRPAQDPEVVERAPQDPHGGRIHMARRVFG